MQTSPVELPGLGGMIALSLVSLGVVCLVAYVLLRLLSLRYQQSARGQIRIIERCVLEPRRSVFLIEVRGRQFFIGSGEGGITSLAELDPSQGPPLTVQDTAKVPITFQSVMGRLLRRKS